MNLFDQKKLLSDLPSIGEELRKINNNLERLIEVLENGKTSPNDDVKNDSPAQ